MPIAPKLLPTKNLTTTKNKIKKNDPPGLFFLGLLFLGSFFIPGVLSVIDALFILVKILPIIALFFIHWIGKP